MHLEILYHSAVQGKVLEIHFFQRIIIQVLLNVLTVKLVRFLLWGGIAKCV